MRTRSGSSFRNTDKMINTLIVNTIETGAVTAIVVLLELAFYLHQPDNFVHVAMYVVTSFLSSLEVTTNRS